ncbi:MAG TPA: nucleotidyl transferase AbiEii/AbiGii toxin family protein [Rhizomicrobium sp.]
MPLLEKYRQQVTLLVRTLPLLTVEREFALKGGTAINLFVRDMLRLSVDIDLTYTPVSSWEQSLAAIDAGMKRIAASIAKSIPNAKASLAKRTENAVTRIIVNNNIAQIKIEVTPVLRGCVYEPKMQSVNTAVEEQFGFAEANLVSFADLYGGKIVAALDRQHPRDLFDVRELLANEGMTDELRKAFLVYLISHGRPMHEVLAPTLKNISAVFANEFEGMTDAPVTVDQLTDARAALLKAAVLQMPDGHRQFLIGFELGEPNWELLDLPHIAQLPAVLWRQKHLNTRNTEQRAALVAKLRTALSGG